MSQPAVAPAPVSATTPSARAPTSTPAAEATAAPAAAGRVVSTRHRLRRLTLALVVTSILVGLLGALTFSYLAYSVHRAEADTLQLIRVQKIETNLLGADATATNAFLVGGLEPPAQRAAYDQAISSTGALIAEAAQAQPADANALAALNQQVLAYASTIEQARANNRQGFPVGSQYLRTASAHLRSDALPILDLLVSTNADRARSAMDLRIGAVFVVVGLLAVAGAIAAHTWLARRFRRRINPGVLAATILLAVAFLTGGAALSRTGTEVNNIRDGSLRLVNTAAQARIKANDAKANESLTLIARGSGAAFEQAWKDSAGQVSSNLEQADSKPLTDRWSAYTAVHSQIRSQDDDGAWGQAVATATGTGPKSANTAFNAFDAALSDFLQNASTLTANSLAARQPGLVIAAIVTLLAGLAAALLGRRGVAARLEEYR